ncbi:HAMP domain-containing sensor histidine kinase [Enterococcus hulanensis]|uniref:sensor histidine kinase n=1 Tax=Enterococcus hulanensis TaxID=2559929 RepID=UPI00288F73B6|nr:HAMP domain-containing sensor histidine kinase [Enterococcus hulanensis]MDT2661956.1 HAMP domain-containing sensor histidine kinase [Enterococcus hulanensis]
MLKTLRRRFILFNMLVVLLLVAVLAVTVFVGTKNELSLSRVFFAAILCIVLAFFGSWLISKQAVLPIKNTWQKQLDFTADASHELRTPLAVIRTNLEIVMDCPTETVASQMKWLENMYLEQQHMERLVSDLLTISRSDTGEEEIQQSTFSLDKLLQDIAAKFTPICQQKQITLQVNLSPKVTFYGDQQRLTQLVMILLDNAYQYSNEGGEITLTLENRTNDLQLSIKDTGIGISEENIAKLFDRFFRVTNSRRKNPDGLGLGLSIAKLITEQHKGEISVTSVPGVGSSFTVTLPKLTP